MEEHIPYGDANSVWGKCQRLTVNPSHAIVIPKANRPGAWFAPGPAFLAPLYRKRTLLIERAKWVYAWTLYTEKLGTSDWITPRETNASLHLPIELTSRNPTGWYFTVPLELRRKGWLPESGGFVMYEYSESEANFWTEAPYNEESTLEADSC
jgi:hypothetical protein